MGVSENDIPESEEEFNNYIINGYEKEILIAKRVFFPSLIFLIIDFIYFGFNRPNTTNEFLLFMGLFSIPAALCHTSAVCYCLAKSSVLKWKYQMENRNV